MKKLKALICKWFGHKWVEKVSGNTTGEICKRCGIWGSFKQEFSINIFSPDYTDSNSQHFKDYLKVLKGGKK